MPPVKFRRPINLGKIRPGSGLQQPISVHACWAVEPICDRVNMTHPDIVQTFYLRPVALSQSCSHESAWTLHLTARLPQFRRNHQSNQHEGTVSKILRYCQQMVFMQKEFDLTRCHSMLLTFEGTSYEREPAFQSSSSASDTPLGDLGTPVQPRHHCLCCT